MSLIEIEKIDLENAFGRRMCMPYNDNCGQEAAWLLTKTCCGVEIPLCDKHKERALKELEHIVNTCATMKCGVCGRDGIVPSMSYFDVEML
jgi:hypothetical protein